MIGRVQLKLALIGAGAAVLLGTAPAGAADDVETQIEALQKKVDELAAAAGGTSVTVSGFVKGDFYIDSHDDLGRAFDPTMIRIDGAAGDDADDGSFGMHAGQSRVRIGTSTSTSFGDLNTVVEGHFFGDDAFGLRHAYGQLGPVLAGQAWSIISEEDTAADTVDFNGPAGTIWTRQPQLRLSLPMGEGFTGQMAIEPGYEGNELPKFLAAVRFRAGWGAVNLTGSVGRIDVNVAEAPAVNWQTAEAHVLHAGATFNVTDATRVMATLSMTRGLGLIWGGGPGTLTVGDDLKTQDTMGGIAGISHSWSDSIRSGAYFGWAQTDTASGVPAAVAAGSTDDDGNFTPHNKAVQTLHTNVIWSPVPQANIGFEVMHGWRETNPQVDANGAIDRSAKTSGQATRVQIGVQYSF